MTGAKGGLLTHAGKPEDWPKIFYTNSYEYYGRDAALIHAHPTVRRTRRSPPTRASTFSAEHGPPRSRRRTTTRRMFNPTALEHAPADG